MFKFKKILSLLLALTMVMSIGTTTFAAVEYHEGTDVYQKNTLKETPFLTVVEKENFSKWVAYNEETRIFYIKDGATKNLSNSEYNKLSECLKNTNFNIKNADFSSGEISVVTPADEKNISQSKTTRAYVEGVTKIEFHW